MMTQGELNNFKAIGTEVLHDKAYAGMASNMADIVLQLCDEVEALREALSFYADAENYETVWHEGIDASDSGYESPVETDGGRTAAAALEAAGIEVKA